MFNLNCVLKRCATIATGAIRRGDRESECRASGPEKQAGGAESVGGGANFTIRSIGSGYNAALIATARFR